MLGKIIFQCTFRWVRVIPQCNFGSYYSSKVSKLGCSLCSQSSNLGFCSTVVKYVKRKGKCNLTLKYRIVKQCYAAILSKLEKLLDVSHL